MKEMDEKETELIEQALKYVMAALTNGTVLVTRGHVIPPTVAISLAIAFEGLLQAAPLESKKKAADFIKDHYTKLEETFPEAIETMKQMKEDLLNEPVEHESFIPVAETDKSLN